MRRGGLRIVVGVMALFALSSAARAGAEPVTFTKDIAPLLFTHCASCHRPGGVSSTVLLTYRNARTHARQIVDRNRESMRALAEALLEQESLEADEIKTLLEKSGAHRFGPQV